MAGQKAQLSFVEASGVAFGVFILAGLSIGLSWIFGFENCDNATLEVGGAAALCVFGVMFRNRFETWFDEDNIKLTLMKVVWICGPLMLIAHSISPHLSK